MFFGVSWGCFCPMWATAVLLMGCAHFGCFSASAVAAAARYYAGRTVGVLHGAVTFWWCGFVRYWAALYCLYAGVFCSIFSGPFFSAWELRLLVIILGVQIKKKPKSKVKIT